MCSTKVATGGRRRRKPYAWFYEATAAGILIHCDCLFFPTMMIRRYRRSCAVRYHEKKRDEADYIPCGPTAYGAKLRRVERRKIKIYLTGLCVSLVHMTVSVAHAPAKGTKQLRISQKRCNAEALENAKPGDISRSQLEKRCDARRLRAERADT